MNYMPGVLCGWIAFNTRVVLVGVVMLGCAAGMIGTFTLLRKRALLGDALSHATLPGIGLAFLLGVWLRLPERSLSLLLSGALCTGLLGVGTILAIRQWTRLKDDVAMGIVLSVYFGLGVAILSVIQQMPVGHAAGLESFIYGKTATMVVRDARLIAVVSGSCMLVAAALFKELRLLCFDESFAQARGIPVLALDMVLMGLVVTITMIGLQAVGAILVIALLVIPAAAARFWTEAMAPMAGIAAVFGALSSGLGAMASDRFPRLPSGPMIVLACAAVFAVSLLIGTRRGLLIRVWRQGKARRRIGIEHVLRAIYEQVERQQEGREGASQERTVSLQEILPMRSWSSRELNKFIRGCESQGFVQRWGSDAIRLTESGWRQAERCVHEHRLLELYLISHADVAPSQVDPRADTIEHYLDPDLIAHLEEQLGRAKPESLPSSPHRIGGQ